MVHEIVGVRAPANQPARHGLRGSHGPAEQRVYSEQGYRAVNALFIQRAPARCSVQPGPEIPSMDGGSGWGPRVYPRGKWSGAAARGMAGRDAAAAAARRPRFRWRAGRQAWRAAWVRMVVAEGRRDEHPAIISGSRCAWCRQAAPFGPTGDTPWVGAALGANTRRALCRTWAMAVRKRHSDQHRSAVPKPEGGR
jgi:hypothetical protein